MTAVRHCAFPVNTLVLLRAQARHRRVKAFLEGKGALPADALIAAIPRAGKPLEATKLAIPR